jgi:hypothetical protein
MVALRSLVYDFFPYMYHASPHVLYNFITFVLPDVCYLVPKHVSSNLFSIAPFVIPYSLPKLLPFWLVEVSQIEKLQIFQLGGWKCPKLGTFF